MVGMVAGSMHMELRARFSRLGGLESEYLPRFGDTRSDRSFAAVEGATTRIFVSVSTMHVRSPPTVNGLEYVIVFNVVVCADPTGVDSRAQ